MPNLIDELLNRPIPEKLWHYTSIQGFQAIVTSKSMWATDALFLNDREELIHVEKFATRLIEAASEQDEEGYPIKEWLSTARRVAPVRGIQVFVACFTQLEDDLSQWRAYSHASTGVSLAFDLRSVRPPQGSESMVAFAPCIYIDERKSALAKEALQHFIDEVRSYYRQVYESACQHDPMNRQRKDKSNVVKEFLKDRPGEMQPYDRYLSAVVRTRINWLQVSALSKNSSFHGEEEWRLVLPMLEEPSPPPQNPPQFRVGNTTLIPYVAHPTNFPLVEVVLGPGSDENSISAAQRFLKSEGLNIKPRLSKVPYRAVY